MLDFIKSIVYPIAQALNIRPLYVGIGGLALGALVLLLIIIAIAKSKKKRKMAKKEQSVSVVNDVQSAPEKVEAPVAEPAIEVKEETAEETVEQVPVDEEVAVETVQEQVDEQGLFSGRFAVFHVDLARNSLHPIDHRGRTFGNLNAFQPLPRNVRKAEGRRQAPHHRTILIQHLGINSRQTQQSNLFGSGNSIGVPHGHTRRVLKTLSQVAASHLTQTSCRNHLCLHRRNPR